MSRTGKSSFTDNTKTQIQPLLQKPQASMLEIHAPSLLLQFAALAQPGDNNDISTYLHFMQRNGLGMEIRMDFKMNTEKQYT